VTPGRAQACHNELRKKMWAEVTPLERLVDFSCPPPDAEAND